MRFMLRHRAQDVHLADDLYQDTFLIVLRRISEGGLEDPNKLSGYVHRTALNVFLGYVRTKKRRRTDSDTQLIERLADDDRTQLSEISQVELGRVVALLLAELTQDRDRDILRRFYLLGQSKKEICSVLGMSPALFDSVMSKARARFKKIVEDHPEFRDLLKPWDDEDDD